MCRVTLILFLLTLLGGCQLLTPALPPLAAPLHSEHQLEHLLTLTRGGKQFRLRCMLETGNGETRVIALNEAGLVLVQMRQDANGLTVQRSALLPDTFPAEQVMADIQLIFWPDGALHDTLPTAWSLRVEARSRTLYHNDKPVTQVHYQGSPWQTPTALNNLRYRYQLMLTPLNPDTRP